jgi:hypothetical protein
MLEGLPDVVRRHFELDPPDVEAFVSLFTDDATVVDEGRTYHGLGEVRAWRTGPAIKYTYTTEVFGSDAPSAGRYLVTGRLTGNFPGRTADLRWDFTVTGNLISRLVIGP